MANLNDERAEGVSLFPMSNILACTLGVMVFVLATVATVSPGADKVVELIAAESSEEMLRGDPVWLEWYGANLVLHPDGVPGCDGRGGAEPRRRDGGVRSEAE